MFAPGINRYRICPTRLCKDRLGINRDNQTFFMFTNIVIWWSLTKAQPGVRISPGSFLAIFPESHGNYGSTHTPKRSAIRLYGAALTKGIAYRDCNVWLESEVGQKKRHNPACALG